MNFDIRMITEGDANEIATWRYEPPYDLYNLSYFDIPFLLDPENRYYAVYDQADDLIGFGCFGAEARVPGGDYRQTEPRVLDVGVGLRPDLVGRGLGGVFVDAVLQYGIEEFRPERLRVTVATFNERSLNVFQKLGFLETHGFVREGDGMAFVQMDRTIGQAVQLLEGCNMDVSNLIARMANNAAAICSMVQAVSDEQAHWRPDPDSWSILEVINHLRDEEREDFRVRLDIILHDPERPWPPIDPQGWITERNYNQRDLQESVENFMTERRNSIAWLEELDSVGWGATSEAPWGGQIRAGDMFTAWVAHDLMHMRQLVELLYAYTTELSYPYQADYAGEW